MTDRPVGLCETCRVCSLAFAVYFTVRLRSGPARYVDTHVRARGLALMMRNVLAGLRQERGSRVDQRDVPNASAGLSDLGIRDGWELDAQLVDRVGGPVFDVVADGSDGGVLPGRVVSRQTRSVSRGRWGRRRRSPW